MDKSDSGKIPPSCYGCNLGNDFCLNSISDPSPKGQGFGFDISPPLPSNTFPLTQQMGYNGLNPLCLKEKKWNEEKKNRVEEYIIPDLRSKTRVGVLVRPRYQNAPNYDENLLCSVSPRYVTLIFLRRCLNG
jgi:hypothetical protein